MCRPQFPRPRPPRRPVRQMVIAALGAASVFALTATEAGADDELPVLGCTPDVVSGYLQQNGLDYDLHFTSEFTEYAVDWDATGIFFSTVSTGACRIVLVPDVVDLRLADAVARLDEVGLRHQADAQEGLVFGQTPADGSWGVTDRDWVELDVEPFPSTTPAPTPPPTPGPQGQPPTPAPVGPGPGPGPQSPTSDPPGPQPQQTTPDRPGSSAGGESGPVPTTDDSLDSTIDPSAAARRSSPPYAWAGLWVLGALGGLAIAFSRWSRRHRRATPNPEVRVNLRRSRSVSRLIGPAGATDAPHRPSIRVVRAPALVTIYPTVGTRFARRQPT
jgi:PASTA domain